MALTDDLRKTLTDPTPLYALAGTADLAAEKLGEVPALVDRLRSEAPKRLETARATDPKALQERLAQQAKEAQNRLGELLGSLDGDLRKVREQAQGLALQGVGRAAEYAVKARETYDELAERGRGAVRTWRGEAAEDVTDLAVVIEPDPAPVTEPSAATPVRTEPAPPAPEAGQGSSPATPEPTVKDVLAAQSVATPTEKSPRTDDKPAPAKKATNRRTTGAKATGGKTTGEKTTGGGTTGGKASDR